MNARASLLNRLGIDTTPPRFVVILILTIVMAIEIGLLLNSQKIQDHEIWKNLEALVFIFTWFIMLTTPLVEWLRNGYVLCAWFVICILWYNHKTEQDIITAVMPLGVLIYALLSRLLFKAIVGYHPVHVIFNHYAVARYSALNNRTSSKIDYWYSLMYTLVGIKLSAIVFLLHLTN